MLLRYFIGLVFVAMVCNAAAFAQSDAISRPEGSCNLKDSISVHWQALNETVTLHTEVSQEGDYYPRAKLKLEFSDGKTLDLGDGGKYYDDYSQDNAPSCEHIVAAATNPTIVSLNDKTSLWRPELYEKTSPYENFDIKIYRNMSDLRADLLFSQSCDMKDEDYEVASRCASLENITEEISRNKSNFPKHKFDSLVTNNAPIITVSRSTYYSETYVYDRGENTLYNLYYEGC